MQGENGSINANTLKALYKQNILVTFAIYDIDSLPSPLVSSNLGNEPFFPSCVHVHVHMHVYACVHACTGSIKKYLMPLPFLCHPLLASHLFKTRILSSCSPF